MIVLPRLIVWVSKRFVSRSEAVRGKLIELALEELELSPRELAVRFTHAQGYCVSESTVYRLLKAHDQTI